MPLHVDIHERVGTLTLARPERAHAYDTAHLQMLAVGVRELIDAGVVAAVIRSSGDRAFCGGADLHELRGRSAEDALDLLSQRVFDELARAPFVSVAAIQGPAVAGGFELALACDLRVVGPQARFSLPEVSLGLIPSAGGSTRLPRLVGASVAKQVILAGRTLSAAEACALGLALGPVDDPKAEARALADRMAAAPDPLALQLAKGVLDADLAASLRQERLAEAILYGRKAARSAEGS